MIAAPASSNMAARLARGARLLFCCLLFHAAAGQAEVSSLTNLIAQGDLLSQKHDTPAALQIYLQAEKLSPSNAETL